MVIVGINASHNATACVIKDGKLLACISEERITRVKNQYGLPVKAFREVLKISGIKSSDIDLVVFGYKDPKVNTVFSTLDSMNRVSSRAANIVGRVKEEILYRIPVSRYIYDNVSDYIYKYIIDPKKERELLADAAKKFAVPSDKIIRIDHHLAHAYSAYYSHKSANKKDLLILTLDAMGDGLCSTVNVVKDGKFERIAETKYGNSIGDLYAYVTAYLGMKMGEHEYKVMGMAPYANPKYGENVYQKLKGLISLKDDMTFASKFHTHVVYKILPRIFYKERFDNISYGIQKYTEELVSEWVKLCIKKTGIRDISCAGGIFMNVKANNVILNLEEVKSLFVVPSCGDESTAIGAAYWGYELMRSENPQLPQMEALNSLYLGPEYSDSAVLKALRNPNYKKYKITKPVNIETKIATLLSKGKIVARFSGRMEWGARSLGNRSILSHPANLEAIRVINEQIKSRDFWMPFAPSMISEESKHYLINPKKMESPYMIIAFDSTKKGQKYFKAAMHQYDLSLRPQVVYRTWNEKYWDLINKFKKMTGIGGVLNTSFNLHGYPIVNSPEDALHVFENSGLENLALGNFLVQKK